MGFFRQEHWSGLPFTSPKGTIEIKKVKSVMSDSPWPHGRQPTGFSLHWTLQARVLEWVAISFSRRRDRLPNTVFLGFLGGSAGKKCPTISNTTSTVSVSSNPGYQLYHTHSLYDITHTIHRIKYDIVLSMHAITTTVYDIIPLCV